MTIRQLLHKMVNLAESGEEVMIVARERCDCGDAIRHNNGGNYHNRAWVRYSTERREFIVTLGNSREWFPGDEEYMCSVCERTYRNDEHHVHIPLEHLDTVATNICEHIREGSVYLLRSNGHDTIAAAYL